MLRSQNEPLDSKVKKNQIDPLQNEHADLKQRLVNLENKLNLLDISVS